MNQISKENSSKDHPYHKFSTGNLDTLSEIPKKHSLDVRKALLEFHSKMYSADVMKLVIVGREELDKLEEWARSMFSGVENKKRGALLWRGLPFSQEQLCTVSRVVPVQDVRELQLSFQLPSQLPLFHEKPTDLFSHLFGHEAKGSILYHLKQKGLATALASGASASNSSFFFFDIVVDLTEEGLNDPWSVLQAIFEYVHLLRKEGVEEWVFKELKALGEISFRFKEKEEPRSLATSLAPRMHYCPPHLLLQYPYLLDKFDPKLIEEYLHKYFTPENCSVVILSKEFESVANLTEKWYKAKYSREKIPQEVVQRLKESHLDSQLPQLHLPKPNIFVAEKFDIKSAEHTDANAPPQMVRQESFCKV